MKKYFSVLFALLISYTCFAQPGKKPATNEKAPTQKEMEDMMKQAQKMMEEISPEDKKLMDSMGIKMPSFKNVPQVGDKALAAAFEDEMRVVPVKKTELIAALPKKIFSVQELMDYLKKNNTAIAALIKPESKQIANKVMEQFKKDPYYGAMIASAANGMWAAGFREAAVYLMGKATEVLPNADNFNNYAAYLTMGGAAHIAIPVLEKLNSVHKNNSTILNNLGQAWLQLGDEMKGEKYLDSAIRIYACHPQANYTKCLLLKSRGKHAEAKAAIIRSLKHSVTKSKLRELKELEEGGYKQKGYYAPRVYYSTTFDLNAYTALVPKSYALQLGGQVEKEWEAFRKKIEDEQAKIEKQMQYAQRSAQDQERKFATQAIKQAGIIHPPYHQKAVDRYNTYVREYEEKTKRDAEKFREYANGLGAAKGEYDEAIEKETIRFNKELEAGGSRVNNCKKKIVIINTFLKKTNSLNQQFNEENISKLLKNYYNLYYYTPSIANTDASAQLIVLSLRNGFLEKLKNLKHESDMGYPCSVGKPAEPDYKIKKLPDYDEVNCKILNTITSPGIGVIIMRCNNMSMQLNPTLLPFKATLTMNLDGYAEEASIGIKLKAVDIGAGAQFDKDGNFVKGSGSVGTSIKGVGVEIGAEIDKDGNITKGTGKLGTTIKGIDISLEGEVDANGFKKGSVELGLENELKFLPEGLEGEAPVEISLKNELGLGIELDKEMIADFYVKDNVKGDIAGNIEIDNNVEITPGTISSSGVKTDPEIIKLALPSAPSVSVSADNRWSVNSGYSAKGSSNLSSLKPGK